MHRLSTTPPRVLGPEEFAQESACCNASEAAVLAIQIAHLQQEEQARRSERFKRSLEVRIARIEHDKRRVGKDKDNDSLLSTMRNRIEQEEKRQASEYVSSVRKCTMDQERKNARAFAERTKPRCDRRLLDVITELTLRIERACERQASAVDGHVEAVARKKGRKENLKAATDSHNITEALIMERLERLQKQGLRLPRLCSCRHAVSPWNAGYIQYCDQQCPLYQNYQQYRCRLVAMLTDICRRARTMDAKVLGRIYGLKTTPFNDPLVLQQREQIWQRCRNLEKSRFFKALQAMQLETLQRNGVAVPPLCACGHGTYPLDPEYYQRCYPSCPLYQNPTEYKRRLLEALDSVINEDKGGPPRSHPVGVPPILLNVKWKKNTAG